jgi:hypothetical protein
MYMPNVNLPLPAEMLNAVDVARGREPRTAWIRDAIDHRLVVHPSLSTDPDSLPTVKPTPAKETADAKRTEMTTNRFAGMSAEQLRREMKR